MPGRALLATFLPACLAAGVAAAQPAGPAAAPAAEPPPAPLDAAAPLPHEIIGDFLRQSGIAAARAPELYRGMEQVGPVQPMEGERPGCTDYSLEPQRIAPAGPGAASLRLQVRGSGSRAPWQVAASADWITVAQAAGQGEGEVLVRLAANGTPLPRDGEVVLLCGGNAVRRVPVQQPAAG